MIQKNHLKAARSVSDQARQCARAHFLIPRYLTVVDDGNGSTGCRKRNVSTRGVALREITEGVGQNRKRLGCDETPPRGLLSELCYLKADANIGLLGVGSTRWRSPPTPRAPPSQNQQFDVPKSLPDCSHSHDV